LGKKTLRKLLKICTEEPATTKIMKILMLGN